MWNYGDAGDRIPVRVGDVWRAGPHLFACGDLLNGIAEKLFAYAGRLPDHVYCDPPWTKGNMSAFFTKAGQQTSATFESFLIALIRQMQPITGSVFIEMGAQEKMHLKQVLLGYGGRVLGEWQITYYRKHPCHLLHATFGDEQPIADLNLTGMDDDFTPRAALEAATQPGAVVMDFCTGRGLTAVTAHHLGRIAWGTELNPRRLAVTLDKLSQWVDIEKVGTI